MPDGKTKFKNCPKCNGYIPEPWTKHEFNKKENKPCGWGMEYHAGSEFAKFKTAEELNSEEIEIQNQIHRQVIVKAFGNGIWALYNPQTEEEVNILLKRTHHFIKTGVWLE